MKRSLFLLSGLAVLASASAQTGSPNWGSYGRSFTHRANSPAPTQDLNAVLWSASVDRHPQYVGGDVLLTHYGSPLITHNNVVVFPVKTGAKDGFVIEGRNGSTGSLIYTFNTDYSLPAFPGLDWIPTCGPALSPDGRLYVPAAGGTILRRDNPEAGSSSFTRLTFYGPSLFSADRTNYSQNVKICTPLTVDGVGNIYFGFITFGTSMDKTKIGAAQLISGIARVTPGGVGTWKPVTAITGDLNATHVQVNCAPALSPDGTIVYVGVKKAGGGGYLVGLNSTTLALKYLRRLYDPSTGNEALLTDQSSGAPMVGTDGDVYFGILANPHSRHNFRGFLMHYDKTLAQRKTVGSFGWDTTPSLVPSSIVPSYAGVSPYLILTKYNNYAGIGDGVNKVAVLDPNATQVDFLSGIPVMKEVLTVKGPTPDPNHIGSFPNAVWEWCITSTVIDFTRKSALINSEDGRVYRWDFTTNTLTQGVLLDGPRGQAYTPTISGPTGIVYAINNRILFAVGAGAG